MRGFHQSNKYVESRKYVEMAGTYQEEESFFSDMYLSAAQINELVHATTNPYVGNTDIAVV